LPKSDQTFARGLGEAAVQLHLQLLQHWVTNLLKQSQK